MINRPQRNDSASDFAVSIPVVIATPHLYLTQAVVEQLFCDRYQLHEQSLLSDADQFVAREFVSLIGPRGRLDNVYVIGPTRLFSRVEISHSDGILLGIEAPIRGSSDLVGTPGIRVQGPRTSVQLDCGVICAQRQVHMDPIVAHRLGLKDRDCVDVARESADHQTLFDGVVIRVSPAYRLGFHLNADDAMAAGMHGGEHVLINHRSMTNPAMLDS